MTTVLLTRPQEDARELAALLKEKNIGCVIEPMLRVEPLNSQKAALAAALKRRPQAMLVTSKHAVAALAGLNAQRALPLIAVGEASAAHARKLGFTKVTAAKGTAKALIAEVRGHCTPGGGPLLYLRGEQVSTDIAKALKRSRFEVDSLTLYRAAAAQELSPDLRTALQKNRIDAVLFFSARSAAVYAKLAVRCGLEAAHADIYALCLSAAVAKALRSLRWKDVISAKKPDRKSMIELVSMTSLRK